MDGESPFGGSQRNVLGGLLETCSLKPITGYFRDGCCHTDMADQGIHTVCAFMDDAFLIFSKHAGNDLSTPRPEFDFAGLKAGNYWCICAARWEEARLAGVAPKVNLKATNHKTLSLVSLEDLIEHAL